MCLALGSSTAAKVLGVFAYSHTQNNKHARARGVRCLSSFCGLLLLRWPSSFVASACWLDAGPLPLGTLCQRLAGDLNQERQLTVWDSQIDAAQHLLFWTTISDPNGLRENYLKRKFQELPDQVTIDDRPRNKHRGGLRLDFMISCYQINVNLNLRIEVTSI